MSNIEGREVLGEGATVRCLKRPYTSSLIMFETAESEEALDIYCAASWNEREGT